MAKRMRNKCPPGVLCLSEGLGMTLFLLLFVALLFFLFAVFFIKPVQSALPTIIMPRTQPQHTTVIPVKGGDSRYDIAPQPLRNWMSPPEFPPRGGIASIPINIPTQGLPESFQSIGTVNIDNSLLPLYGRRTTGGNGDRWNYYTRTDTYNPVPIPVTFQKRDCMDDVGCKEILSGDEIKLDGINKSGKTQIYRFDGPKYIPGLI